MNLLQLLTKENIQWPTKAVAVMQDADGEIKFSSSTKVKIGNGIWLRGNETVAVAHPKFLERASDWKTKVLTRKEFEATKDPLDQEIARTLEASKQHVGVILNVIAEHLSKLYELKRQELPPVEAVEITDWRGLLTGDKVKYKGESGVILEVEPHDYPGNRQFSVQLDSGGTKWVRAEEENWKFISR